MQIKWFCVKCGAIKFVAVGDFKKEGSPRKCQCGCEMVLIETTKKEEKQILLSEIII